MAAAPPAHATFPGANGKIAFTGPGGINLINPDGSGQTLLTGGMRPDWSPDGKRIAYIGAGVSDPNCSYDHGGIPCNGGDLYVINADGTGKTDLTPTMYATEGYEGPPVWAPDGQWIAFTRVEGGYHAYKIRPDGTDETQIPLPAGGAIKAVAWSPDGGKLAYAWSPSIPYLFTADLDGSGATKLCCPNPNEYATRPDWAPDGHALVFIHGNAPGTIMRVNRDGSGLTILSNSNDPEDRPVWSPDGRKILFTSLRAGSPTRLFTMNPDGSFVQQFLNIDSYDPAWQPIPINTYPRPKGATPMRVSLVLAQKQCTAPNSTHGAPLSYGSCNPPVQTSNYLTVGAPPQEAANSVGSVLMRAFSCPACVGPGPNADVRFDASITDVRNKNDLSDYTGELQADAALRITDKDNTPSPGGPGAGTVSDTHFPFTVPCAATSDTTVGSTCSVSTSANAILPNSVLAGQRAIWQLGQVQVYDGGADGAASTTADNTLFMDEGIFVP